MNPRKPLSEPRGYFGTAMLIFGVSWAPFAILWTWAMSKLMRANIIDILPFGLGAGVLFGLLLGLVMGHLLKGAIRRVAMPDAESFNARLQWAIAEIGYLPDVAEDNLLIFKPTFRTGLLAGRISVVLEDREVTIAGPKMYVERLVKRLLEQS